MEKLSVSRLLACPAQVALLEVGALDDSDASTERHAVEKARALLTPLSKLSVAVELLESLCSSGSVGLNVDDESLEEAARLTGCTIRESIMDDQLHRAIRIELSERVSVSLHVVRPWTVEDAQRIGSETR